MDSEGIGRYLVPCSQYYRVCTDSEIHKFKSCPVHKSILKLQIKFFLKVNLFAAIVSSRVREYELASPHPNGVYNILSKLILYWYKTDLG